MPAAEALPYTIVAARNAGVRDSQYGQLVKWYVTLETNGEVTHNVYWQRKPESSVEVGDQCFGRIEDGDYGPRFYAENPEEQSGGIIRNNKIAAPGDSNGGGGSPPSAPAAFSGSVKDAEIRWQVCLKVAAQVNQARAVPPEELIGYARAVFKASPNEAQRLPDDISFRSPNAADGPEKRLPADDGIAF